MTDDVQKLAEGHQVDFRSTEGPLRPVECRLGPTEGCFRQIEGLLRPKEDHFRTIEDHFRLIEDHLGRQMVYETSRFAEGPSDRQLG